MRTQTAIWMMVAAAGLAAAQDGPQRADLEHLKPNDDLRAQVLRWLNVDLAGADLRKFGDVLPQTQFDTDTPWPPAERLPEGFDPAAILERCKNPGLGIRALHAQGLRGEGVHVAIIDQPLLRDHPEYTGQIAAYKTIDCADVEPQMHGPAVASLLVGNTCGVAPRARLHFWAEPSWKRDYQQRTQALREIIAYNKMCPKAERIRVVSVSIGFNPKFKNLELWKAALKDAAEAGVGVVHCSGNIFGAGCDLRSSLDQAASYQLCAFARQISGQRDWLADRVCAPIDNRTVAGPDHARQYTFFPQGGLSWAAPYLAGVLAIGYQIDPDAKPEDLAKLLHSTATPFADGGRLVNPSAFVDAVRKAALERTEKPRASGL